MWLPENLAMRHADFTKAYELIDIEKQIILGLVRLLRKPTCKILASPCLVFVDAQIMHLNETSYGFLSAGIHPPCVDNTDATINRQPLERMQTFLTMIHDSW